MRPRAGRAGTAKGCRSRTPAARADHPAGPHGAGPHPAPAPAAAGRL